MVSLTIIVEFVESVAVLVFASVLLALLGRRLDQCRWRCQVVVGAVLGAAGVLSMAGPVIAGPGLVFDARAVVVVLAGPLAGPIATAVAAAMVASMRVATGGPGAVAGVASIALAAVAGLLVWDRLRRRGRPLSKADLPLLALASAMVPVLSVLLLPTWAMAFEVLSTATPLSAAANVIGVGLLGLLVLWDRERRAASAALRESEARLRAIADNAPGALYQRVKTADGKVSFRFVSDGAADIVGIPASEIVRDPGSALGLMLAEDVARYERSIDVSEKTLAPWRFDGRFRRPDGKLIWLHGQSTPRRGPGGETIWDGFVLDITERKQMEEQLVAARLAAEEANAAKSRFLALVTHELRSPLTAISGYVDLMRSGVHGPVGDARYDRYLETIRTASTHLAAVIDDLMDVSKVEAGKVQLTLCDFDLAGLVQEVVDMQRVRADGGGVVLETAVPQGCRVRADRGRLRQVLLNLTTNAIRFTPPGGRVRIAAALGGDGDCRIAVSDTGIGIAPADLARVLEPFVQIDNEVNRKGGGTGLGLPLSKRLVELHGGSLSLDSAPGSGTTVTVTLPVEDAARPRSGSAEVGAAAGR